MFPLRSFFVALVLAGQLIAPELLCASGVVSASRPASMTRDAELVIDAMDPVGGSGSGNVRVVIRNADGGPALFCVSGSASDFCPGDQCSCLTPITVIPSELQVLGDLDMGTNRPLSCAIA